MNSLKSKIVLMIILALSVLQFSLVMMMTHDRHETICAFDDLSFYFFNAAFRITADGEERTYKKPPAHREGRKKNSFVIDCCLLPVKFLPAE